MIARNSPLRRLPSALSRRQKLIFDGIRHSAEIVGLAHARLAEVLTHVALTRPVDEEADRCYTSAFLDAWAIVDAIDRFRMLWPLVVNDLSGELSFSRIAQPIRDLRNVADHLAQRIEYVVAEGGTAHGILTWVTVTNAELGESLICTIVPGSMSTRNIEMVNPGGRTQSLPTGQIHLAAGEHRACLSDVVAAMAVVVSALEKRAEREFENLGIAEHRSGADLLVLLLAIGDAQGDPTEPAA